VNCSIYCQQLKLLHVCSRFVHMFATGDGLLRQTDGTTDDGLKQIFATNLFGHFILVSLLVYVVCILACMQKLLCCIAVLL